LRIIDTGVWGCQITIDNTAIIHSVQLQGYPIWYEAVENSPIPKYKWLCFCS
jgi:hypothetical protein